MKLLRRSLLPLFTFALLATTGAQQPTASEPANAPASPTAAATIESQSRLVVVDVVATDSHGEPIKGLTRNDFTVLEDGKPQQLKVFENHDGSAPPPAPAPETAQAEGDDTIPATQDQDDDRPLNIVLLDALNTQTQDQQRVHQHMVDLLKNLPPGPEIAVFTLTERLRELQPFTSDRDALLAAINKVKVKRSAVSGENTKDDQEMLAAEVRQLPEHPVVRAMIANMKQFVAESSANSTDVRVKITLEALREIAQSVKGFPGRKNLLWVSGTVPFSILADANLKQPDAVIRNYGPQIRQTAVMLSEAQVAVYTIDPVGVSSQQLDASYSSTVQDPTFVYSAPELTEDMRRNEMSSRASMEELAQVTGGHAFYNRNDIKLALEKSISLGSTYYTLAYTPTNRDFDGTLRHIVVKVPRKDARLAYRREYYAIREGSGVSDADKEHDLMVALNPQSPELTGLHLKASLTPPDDKGKTKVRYTIIPGQLAASDGAESAVNLEFVAVGWNGKGEDLGHSMLNVRVPNGKDMAKQLAEKPLVVDQELDVKPGATFFRFGVLDHSTGRMATLQADLPASYIAAHNAQQASKK